MATDEQALRLDVLSDLTTPWAIRVAATLNLADHIAEGVAGTAELAAKAGVQPDALGRMMRHLVRHDVFAEPEPDVFALTDLSRDLQSNASSRRRAWLDLTGAGGHIDAIYVHMLDAVRHGEPVYATEHGRSFWQDLADNEALAYSFDALMARHAPLFTDIVAGYEWPETGHIVDLGGGTGALVAEILRARPHLRGTVVDLPGTVQGADTVLSGAGVADRCEVVGQSFFTSAPAGGDIYLLSHVLHNWNDSSAVAILRTAAEAAGPNGKILIIEQLADPQVDPASWATRLDLKMLMMMGGRERTVGDVENLAEQVGLRARVIRTTTSNITLIECDQGQA